MNILFDTSVLIAALVKDHPAYQIAKPWLARVEAGSDQGSVGAHTLAELYAKLTRIRFVGEPMPAANVDKLIADNIIPHFEIVSLTSQDYRFFGNSGG